MAHYEAKQGRHKFLIPILTEDIPCKLLSEEMQIYKKGGQFLDAKNIQLDKK